MPAFNPLTAPLPCLGRFAEVWPVHADSARGPVSPQVAGIRARRPGSKTSVPLEAARAVSAKVDSSGSLKRVPSFDAPLHCRSS